MNNIITIRLVNRDNPNQSTEFECPKSFYLMLERIAKKEHTSMGGLLEKMARLYIDSTSVDRFHTK
jgi:predicted DNA-binding ribbon-helix-helix protein